MDKEVSLAVLIGLRMSSEGVSMNRIYDDQDVSQAVLSRYEVFGRPQGMEFQIEKCNC